ncbi:DUF4363 family protein [Lutispora saccharofermentans]|uniref:DUF4363 family protein n=1 Tax=Lutispora saccharofermentans TaxID=3024236 RepID=A0ABT1NA87_9FIRM|nr:DUF4363 family protein [Lutispora saccharofermentans]MCQ1528163.1 DUF4363 family protein [Lutispora saccharofermentans]
MKPLLYTVILTLAIIGSGIFTINMLKKDAEALYNFVLEMESDIMAEKWEDAGEKGDKLHNQWKKYKKVWPMLIDHLEIDNLDIQISELESFLISRDKTQALSKLSILKLLVKHIPEKESFTLQNIL